MFKYRPILTTAGFITLGAIGACGAPRVAARPLDSLLTREEALADYGRMREVLEDGAAALYRYHSREDVARAFDAGAESIRAPITTLDLWRTIAPIIAARGDAHMSLMPSESLTDAIYGAKGRLLPFRLRIVDGRLYVTRAYVAGGPAAGDEVIAINGIETSRLLKQCGELVPVDGTDGLRRHRKIEMEFDYWCGSMLGIPERHDIVYRPRGAEDTIASTIGAITSDSLRLARRRLFPEDTLPVTEAPFKLELNDSAAIMTVRSFSKSDDFNPAKVFEEAFQRISSARVSNLIIDVRDNGGGRDTNASLLYGHIAKDTFSYVNQRTVNRKRFAFLRATDDWYLNFMFFFIRTRKLDDGRRELRMAIDKVQRPREPGFTGRVFVLTNARTFSTASEFVSLVKLNRRGVIVGEETGNAYGGDSGATVSFVLKNSGLVINIPLVQYTLPSAAEPGASRAVQPDVAVSASIGDLLTGRDAVKERALALIRTQ